MLQLEVGNWNTAVFESDDMNKGIVMGVGFEVATDMGVEFGVGMPLGMV